MKRLYSLLAEPVPLLWSQLRTRLPKVIKLPAPEGSADGNELFKRIDLVTRNELEIHLAARTNAQLLEIQELQMLGELYQRSVTAKCGADDPMFAAIDGQGVRP